MSLADTPTSETGYAFDSLVSYVLAFTSFTSYLRLLVPNMPSTCNRCFALFFLAFPNSFRLCVRSFSCRPRLHPHILCYVSSSAVRKICFTISALTTPSDQKLCGPFSAICSQYKPIPFHPRVKGWLILPSGFLC